MSEEYDAQGAFTITFDEREGYVRAFVKGDADTADISMRYWTMISEYCNRNDRRRVLVVESFSKPSSLADVYTVAAELPRLMRGIRVAFIDEHAEHFEQNVFGETVAVNRGGSGRVFRDESAAEEWLRS